MSHPTLHIKRSIEHLSNPIPKSCLAIRNHLSLLCLTQNLNKFWSIVTQQPKSQNNNSKTIHSIIRQHYSPPRWLTLPPTKTPSSFKQKPLESQFISRWAFLYIQNRNLTLVVSHTVSTVRVDKDLFLYEGVRLSISHPSARAPISDQISLVVKKDE